MQFRVDARFHSTPLKGNKGLQKPDPKKLESVLRTKPLKLSQKAGGEKAANKEKPPCLWKTDKAIEPQNSWFSPKKEQEPLEMKQ